MADQHNGNDNEAADDNAENLNVAEENQAGDDIWEQIFDPNFVVDPNAYDYEAHHQVLLQNLQAGHQNNMFLHHNGFPMPQQVAVQPEAVAAGSSTEPSILNNAQPISDSLPDVQNPMGLNENDNPTAGASALPSMEGWGYINEAYQTDSSSLSEFVASNESQQEVSLRTTKEESPEAGCFLGIPEKLVKGIDARSFMRRFYDNTEKDPPNPPNTPVSARSDLDASNSALDCSPNLETSPGVCLRSAVKALRSISEENRNVTDFDGSEGIGDDPSTKSKNVGKSTKSAAKKTVGKFAARVKAKRKSRDDHTEENIQISLSRQPERPDYLFVKFGSFMVILVLLFPLAIIACLQGLLPEKYANAFLILLILSFLGACYFFVKACYVKNNDPLDTTTTSTVKYGTIPNSSRPGTSAESA